MAMRMKVADPAEAKKFFETKLAFTTGPAEVKYIIDKGERPTIVDVRSAKSYAEGHVPGAVSLPEEQWRLCEKVLSRHKTNVIYCYTAVCHLAANAAFYFASRGFPVVELDGGFEAWTDYGYEIEKAETAAERRSAMRVGSN